MMNVKSKKVDYLTLVNSASADQLAALKPAALGTALSASHEGDTHNKVEPINILLVEDNPADRRLVAERLSQPNEDRFHLLYAESISESLQVLAQNKISIILLDLLLPDCRNLESLARIHAAANGVPIVILSEIEDEILALKALKLGAQDFLVKWHTNGHLLVRAIKYALERKQAEEQLYHLAHHDALTGLPNRKFFYDQFKQALAMARRHHRPLAIMFLDLGNFKRINDNLGHHCGDLLLQLVAKRLAGCVREADCLARIGGDEFVIAFTDMTHQEDATVAANKIIDIFAEPFQVEGHRVHARVSIGISLYPSDGDDMESLIKNADLAMYQAKAEGSNTSHFWFYSPEFNARTSELMRMEEQLRQALANNEFIVHYQPQVDIHSGHLVGMEALLRWQHPERGLLMPPHFMKMLEETGVMVTAGEMVLREACRQNKAWQEVGYPPMVVAVNISKQELQHRDFIKTVGQVLQETGLDPAWLELEIKEETIDADEAWALSRLSEIAALGVRIALDNLGHSHIPLSFLTRFPIHAIKIDRSIVTDVATDANHAAVAKAVIAVARVLNIKGLAEGIETQEQFNFFKAEQCDDAQGYMFSQPLTPLACAELMNRLKRGASLPH